LLFGPPESRELAKGILENHPKIRRVDALDNNARLKLFFFSELSNMALLELLAKTGLSGIMF